MIIGVGVGFGFGVVGVGVNLGGGAELFLKVVFRRSAVASAAKVPPSAHSLD